MTTFWILAIPLLIVPLCLRGKALHGFLVDEAATTFTDDGWQVRREYPIRLGNGTVNYADLFVQKGGVTLICEVETSARHALDNAVKAKAAGLPLWVVVPNQKVRTAVVRKLNRPDLAPGGELIRISLKGELRQRLVTVFSCFSTANPSGKKGKSDPEKRAVRRSGGK
jgi:hypothetical protein